MASSGVGGSPELLTVTVQRDEHGYGMKVSGDNPVYVQSVKERGAAWRAGLRSGDKIVRVNGTAVSTHMHMQVVQMIRGNPNVVLTVQQTTQRQKTPITAPVPVDREKQRQLEFTKVNTIRLMLENEQRHMEVLKNDGTKCSDVRKRELESAEQRCARLQNQIDIITSSLPVTPDSGSVPQVHLSPQPQTPKLSNRHRFYSSATGSPPPNNSTGFLSGLPRSLSNLTGQSLRNLRQSRQSMNNKSQNAENMSPPQLERQDSNGESNKRFRHSHNNTVPMVPVTCLDGTLPPPLPPRSIERPQKGNGKRGPLSPPAGQLANPVAPINPLANPLSPQRLHMGANVPQSHKGSSPLMSQSYQGKVYRRSSHSLDADFGGTNGQPNSIAMQMSYPLAVTHPPIQMGCAGQTGGMHVRSQSSPEHLDQGSCVTPSPLQHGVLHQRVGSEDQKDGDWEGGNSPPGTPPPPYPCPPTPNLQPCMDSQRAIISMEEDDAPMSDSSPSRTGLFTSLRSVRDSKARSAVLLNWLLGERRCARAHLLLLVTDAYRAGGSLCGGTGGAPTATLRRWAYEIQSTFVMPQAQLAPSSVDENMAREIDEVLLKEYDKEEILRNVFRKARLRAKEELTQQLSEFQVKRQVGLGTLYGPPDAILEKCDVDKTQECSVVEHLLVARLGALGSEARGDPWGATQGAPAAALPAAALAAAMQHALGVRPAAVSQALGGGTRAAFLQRDKHYKQRVKQIAKQTPQPFIVRGHHLSLHAVMSVSHCHQCHQLIWGLAPQAYMCSDCQLTVHRSCARGVEEACCGPADHNNRISRLMEKIHPTSAHQDSFDKKSRKTSSTSHFLNMERGTRKLEEEATWDVTTPAPGETRWEENTGGASEPTASAGEAGEHAPAESGSEPSRADGRQDAQSMWRGLSSSGGASRDGMPGSRPVARAESCRAAGGGGARGGKQRNASDPNRLTAAGAPHHHHLHGDVEAVGGVPSGSSSSSSLSSRSNESGPAPPDAHVGSPSELSDEEEQLPELWASTVPQEVVDLLSPRQLKRQELIHELITTERSHVRWLRVLQRVFVRPLERSTLLGADELRALFPNLTTVRERHARLYADLRQLKDVVEVRALAEIMMATLGEASFGSSLARFCAGQRMALEALRERRRRCKELHAYLAQREQHPLCERRQLVDLLAAVWQRLTKYQLLLEQIVRTVHPDDGESEEDIAKLNQALDTAKDVLQSVDTAIRMAENQHRLRWIQSRMEVVGGGTDSEDMRRLDLSQHTLLREGDLAIRHDANKKTNMLALLLQDCLVLLHRDGDKFILKQIHQPSQALLSPIVKWSTVLFRPNAAVKNGFFLVNIDGVKMYELSANTSSEYNTWTRIIQEMAISHRPGSRSTPGPSHNTTIDDSTSGGGVSRNPSNASQASTCSVVDDETPQAPAEPATATAVAVATGSGATVESGEGASEKGEGESETEIGVGSGGKHSVERRASSPLELVAAVTVTPAAPTELATQALTMEEQLRRLNMTISDAMQSKCDLVGKMLGLPADSFQSMGDLAVLDTMGHIDIKACMEESCHDSEKEGEGDVLKEKEDGSSTGERTMHQLLLAAQTQANHLTEILTRALSCTDTDSLSSRQYNPWRDSNGLCDLCTSGKRSKPHVHRQNSVKDSKDQKAKAAKAETSKPESEVIESSNSLNSSMTDSKTRESLETVDPIEGAELKADANVGGSGSVGGELEKEISFDMLSELEGVEESERRKMAEAEERLRSVIMEQATESDGAGSVSDCPPIAWWSSPQHSSAQLARSLAPATGTLQSALGELLALLPGLVKERDQLRGALRSSNERYARLAHAHRNCLPVSETDPADLPMDHNAQDPLNGGG